MASARFPGASSVDAFWRNLCDGVESRRVYTDEELKADGVNEATMRHPKHVRSGFVLDDIEQLFDSVLAADFEELFTHAHEPAYPPDARLPTDQPIASLAVS